MGNVILAAATEARPKLRYPAGTLARGMSKLRRYAPSAMFDKQIRKINELDGPASTTVARADTVTRPNEVPSRAAGDPSPHASPRTGTVTCRS